MKVSLNWLKEYIDINVSPDSLGEILTDLGLEVEGIEEVQTVPGGLKGFVTASVLTCNRFEVKEKKLSLCTVDIGDGTPKQVVCGAANVDAGQKVILATVGTQLYNADGSPLFAISAKKTYGEMSEGMICAEDEMNIGTSHDGIMVLPPDTPIGVSASDFFNIKSDFIIEIGLTPNRSDATCHLGVAKDLAASLVVNHGYKGGVKQPDVTAFKINSTAKKIAVRVENHNDCPRYTGVVIDGVKVAESPQWLKDRLTAIGMNTRNNIVDVTNYVMHELGQPLHAFDYEQIKGGEIIVKNLAEGTKFLSLKKNELKENVELSLSAEDLMICDANGEGLCVAGVIGSPTSGVSDTTTTIFLESAHFSPRSARRSGTRHNTRTDSSKVFEKGSDPNICDYALKRAALLIQQLAGGEVASDIIDIYPAPIAPPHIEVFYDNVTRLIGEEIPKNVIKDILTAMGIEMLNPQGKSFVAVVPTNKADVLREVDVIEEILRVYGFNKVTIPTQIRSAIQSTAKPEPLDIRNKTAAYLAANGYNEMMSLSIGKSKHYKEILSLDTAQIIYLTNSLNADLDVMRPTMLFSGLEAITNNLNRQQNDLRLFEFGKTYEKTDTKYKETNRLALFLTGRKQTESWLSKNDNSVDYYTLKTVVENTLAHLGVTGYQMTALTENDTFAFGLRFHRGPQTIVEFGKVKPTVLKKMDIKQAVFYADFNWDIIFAAAKKHKVEFENLSKFQSVRRDLALVIDEKITFNEIEAVANKTAKKLLKDINLFDVFKDTEKLGDGKKSYAVSFVFDDIENGLAEKEIEQLMENLTQQFEQKLGALIRK
jgi:phenylalanyl-tRNA synthetase beta chain